MPRAHINDIEIEYETHGGGEPLLLISGLGGQLTDWTPAFIELLNDQGFRVIRFDNRDSGLSTKLHASLVSKRSFITGFVSRQRARAPYLIDDMAADAAALLDHLGIASAHVVGASMGGMIAQSLAIEQPERVRSLTSVMSHTGSRRHGQPSTSMMLKLPFLGRMNQRNAVEKKLKILEAVSGPTFDRTEAEPRVAAAVARCFAPTADERQSLAILASPDRTTLLRRLQLPTLVIHGRADPLVTPSGGVATARAIRGARLLLFNEMGHDLPRHRWADIVQAITHNADRAYASLLPARI